MTGLRLKTSNKCIEENIEINYSNHAKKILILLVLVGFLTKCYVANFVKLLTS